MRPIVATVAAALAGAAATLAVAPRNDAGAAASASAERTVTLKVGDRVTVAGQPLGCRVARQGGHAIVDCRRGGTLAGSYGTIISAHRALVVRYRDNATAKVVFTAEHGGASRRCD